MNLSEAKVGTDVVVKEVFTDDEELKGFLFSLGCYSGELINVISKKRGGYVLSIKDAINIVDATNLSRSLLFTTQLLELGIPVVVSLNKSDVNEKKGTKIDKDKLSEKLGCPVVETVSTSSNGLKEVVAKAVEIAGSNQKAPYTQGDVDLHNKAEVEKADRKRFEFVNGIVKEVETRKVLTKEKNTGDKLDAVLTHPC